MSMTAIALGLVAGLSVTACGLFVTALAGQMALTFCSDHMEKWWAFPLWMAASFSVLVPLLGGSLLLAVVVGNLVARAAS